MKHAVLLSGLWAIGGAMSTPATAQSEAPRLVVLPSYATVYEVRAWGAGPHPGWTETARRNVAEAWKEAAADSPDFHGICVDDLTEEEQAAVVELQRLVIAIAYQSGCGTWLPVRSPGRPSR